MKYTSIVLLIKLSIENKTDILHLKRLHFGTVIMLKKTLTLFILLLIVLPASADRIKLDSGLVLKGKISEETDTSVTINVDGGGSITFGKSSITEINRDPTPTFTPVPLPTSTPVRIEILNRGYLDGPRHTPTNTPSPTPQGPNVIPDDFFKSPDDMADRISGLIVGKVKSVNGKVEKQNKGFWDVVKEGDVITKGTKIRTASGKLKIDLSDGTDFRLTENTEVKMGEDENVELLRGKIWAKVKKAEEEGAVKFKIKSPNSIAGIRGGGLFSMEMIGGGATRLAVFEGGGEIKAKEPGNPNYEVAASMATMLDREAKLFYSNKPVDPKEINEWNFWDEWANEVQSIGDSFAGLDGGVIGAMGRQIADEQKRYEQIVDLEGRRREKEREREFEFLNGLKNCVAKYYTDMGEFPSTDRPWTNMKYNDFTGMEASKWNGPYLDSNNPRHKSPMRDAWGSDIIFELRHNINGEPYIAIISMGPDKKYNKGTPGTDDVMVLYKPNITQ